MSLLRLTTLLLLLLHLSAGLAARPVPLDDWPQGASLAAGGHLALRVEDGAPLDIAELRQPGVQDRFKPAPGGLRHPGDGRVRWLRVVLEQRAPHGDWVLATQTTALKSVQMHGPFDASGQALAAPVSTGLDRPYASRPLASERYVMRLHLNAPGTYTVYFRVVSDTSQSLDLTVWDTVRYLQARQHKRLFDGMCYGILLALLIYNAVLSRVFRDRTYLYYVCVCGFALLTLASFNGHAAHYLFGSLPWLQERGNVVGPALWMAFSTLFAREFLDTPRLAPRLDPVLLGFSGLGLLSALVGAAGWFTLSQNLNEVGSTAGALVAVAASVRVVRQGFLPALWYLGGQAVLFASVFAVVLENWGLVNAPYLGTTGLQLGVAAEMVVFAIALSSRIRLIRSNQLELRLRAASLAEAAATDPLTGLSNRSGLAQAAERTLADGARHPLMLLDLDRFKPVNDTYGHDAGDRVLKAVAERLLAHIRKGDTVARLGGDEFVVLLAGTPDDARVADLARRLIEAVRQPVDFEGQALSVGVSIGIARAQRHGTTLTPLLHNADMAMYQAKQSGSGFAFYDTPASA